jgi:dienelactone hydrolase
MRIYHRGSILSRYLDAIMRNHRKPDPGLIAFALIFLVLAGPAPAAPAPGDPSSVATNFFDLLVKRDFSAAAKQFDKTMSAALPAEKLSQTWDSLIAQVGPFQKQLGVQPAEYGATKIVLLHCQFANAPIDVKVVLNGQQQVSGLWFQPGTAPTTAPAARYVNHDAFTEQDFTVGKAPWALPGTLSLPKGDDPFPAVILVHGSGPNDRDETIGAVKPFQDLAWGLASRGVAVLRYEKRTKVYPAQMTAQISNLTVKEEVLDDVIAAAAQLRTTPKIDPHRIVVVGHSLGAMLTPRIAALDPNLAGFVMMAAPTRPLEQLFLDQTKYLLTLNGPLDAAGHKQLDQVAAEVKRVQELKPSDAPSTTQLLNAPASYWLDLRAYDSIAACRSIARPVLILQGGRDYQVTTVDFEGWQKALTGRKNVTLKMYPALNHPFIAGTGKSTPSEYDKPGHVDEQVIDDVARFVQQIK